MTKRAPNAHLGVKGLEGEQYRPKQENNMGNACSKKSSVDEGRADAASNVLPQNDTSVAGDDRSRFTLYNDRFTAYNPQAQHLEELILLHQNLAVTRQSVNLNFRRKPIRGSSLEIDGQLCNMSASNPKSEEIEEFLLLSLDSHFAFNSIDNETKMKLVNAMEEERVDEGEWVMHQVSSSRVVEAVCFLAVVWQGWNQPRVQIINDQV